MSTLILFYSYLAALIPLLYAPLLFGKFNIMTSAPLLFYILYKRGLSKALFHAFILGILQDLLASQTPMGFWTFNMVLTLFVLQRLKNLFFIEKIFTLPLLTLFFSCFSSLTYFLLFHTFCSKIHLSLKWVLTDLVVLPVGDALYALIAFSVPYYVLSKFFKETSRRVASINLKKQTYDH